MWHMHQVWAPENDMAASSIVELLRLWRALTRTPEGGARSGLYTRVGARFGGWCATEGEASA